MNRPLGWVGWVWESMKGLGAFLLLVVAAYVALRITREARKEQLTWEEIQASIGILTVAATSLYVLFSIKTFREIKLQTDLQSRAHLSVKALFTPAGSPPQHGWVVSSNGTVTTQGLPPKEGPPLDQGILDLHEKWKKILTTHGIPLKPESKVRLVIQNHGRSDVMSWTLHMRAEIDPGERLAAVQITGGGPYAWIIDSSAASQIVPQGDRIEVDVAPTGFFPKAKFAWTLDYKDVRDVEYTTFIGRSEITDENAFATATAPPTPGPPVAPKPTP